MKKVYFIASMSVVISLIGALYFTENKQSIYQADNQTDIESYQALRLNNLAQLDKTALKPPTLIDSINAFDESFDLTEEELMESAWQIKAENETEVSKYANRQGADEYLAVSFNQTMYLDIGEGDQVSIALPNGESLVVKVTAESLNNNGDYTWRGSVNQQGQEFPVIMTQGENGTYGSIATQSGTYTVTTTNQGVGVIYKNPRLPDSNEDDFLDVPIHS